ncbi:MAG: hypothetical protein HQM15_10485 [Deltaproteobacteria bacterium]|nr:hypothetical protein [Deltaproteobacteria bacterium]
MKEHFTATLDHIFQFFASYLGGGMGGSVLVLVFFLCLCFVLFSLFPKKRKIILFALSLALALHVLGPQVLLCIFLYVLFWYFFLRKMDTLPENRRGLYLKIIPALSFSLYFLLMNASHLGLHLPRDSVQSLGLSYLIWRILHVSVDWKRGKIENKKLGNFLLYVFFFPSLMGGPIERIQRFYAFPFFEGKKWSMNWQRSYFLRFGIGLLKIVISVKLLNLDYASYWSHALSLNYWLVVKIFYLNALTFYLVSSGANDINISISSTIGMPLCENYNYPYFQKNLAHFWRNWHRSLSSILSEYVYEPLGGKNKRQYLNYIFTFFFCGMWHDTTTAFVIWGLAHGLGLCFLRLWQNFCATYFSSLKKILSKYPKTLYAASCLITFHFVAWAWLPFQGGHPQGTILMFRVLGLEKVALGVAKIAGYYPY